VSQWIHYSGKETKRLTYRGVTGNEQDRLPVVIHNCANVGLTTFVRTQGHMELLKTKADALMSPIGPV